MCENWNCPFFIYGDCQKHEDDPCPLEEDDDSYYDDLGDLIYHERVDREICHV